ncbi:membrane protein insertion efficiency factor YidD [Candidatus Omnitrophota bacterium]
MILFRTLITLYQRYVRPLLPRSCRYHPSCSTYFLTALEKKGLVRGTWSGLGRILRCNQFFPGGYDPID